MADPDGVTPLLYQNHSQRKKTRYPWSASLGTADCHYSALLCIDDCALLFHVTCPTAVLYD